MKVAVLGVRESLGKTHLIAALASLYSRSQAKSVAILSTGDIEDNYEIIDIKARDDEVANAKVFRAQLSAADLGDTSLLDYGLRQGAEDVFIFNAMDKNLTEDQQCSFMKECIKKIPADFCIVEICGDLDSSVNKAVFESVDCFLVLVDPSLKGFRKIQNYINNLPIQYQMRTGFILGRYDAEVIAEKRIYKTTLLQAAQTMIWPNNKVIAKLGYEGLLNEVAFKIMRGSDGNLIPIRERLMEILRFIFNSEERKVIKEADKW